MMHALRWLIYAQAFLLGVGCIWLAFEPGWWTLVMVWMRDLYQEPYTSMPQVLLGCYGALQVLTLLGLMQRWWMTHRYSREVSYNTEHGRVSVSLQAIEEALTRAVESEPGVRKVHVRVIEDRVRRQVLIQASLTLWESANVTWQNRRCQDILRRRFSELMPEKTAVQVELSVHRLKQRSPERPTEPVLGDRRRRTTLGEVVTEEPLMTPALAATAGRTGTQAGASLLATVRATTQGSSPVAAVRVEEVTEPVAAARAVERLQRDLAQRSRERSETRVPESEDRQGILQRISGEYRFDSEHAIPADTLEASTVIPRAEGEQRKRGHTAANAIIDGEEVFDDLYFGPTYPVIDDDQELDYSGSPLPADKPPTR